MKYNSFSNGIGSSPWEQNALAAIVGCDIHSKPGTVTGSKGTADSGGSVDALCTACVTTPSGDSFFCGGSKIWKTTAAGTTSLVHTNTQGTTIGIGYLGAYLYYATAAKLGRIALSNASSESTWSSQNDTFGTFTNSASYKPMCVQNLSLFIGDGKYLASVDDTGTFSANVLDLEPTETITALSKDGEYLLIGTVSTSASKAGLFLWDTYSSSWTVADEISEKAINCFIPSDNNIFISAGTIGNIYYWTGQKAELFTRLQDNTTTVTTTINPYASTNLNGLPLYATTRGIFSLGRAGAKFPIAQSIEYVPQGLQGITGVGALTSVSDQVFCATQLATTYRIEKLSTSKYSGVVTTPIALGKYKKLIVRYSSLPTGTSITARISKDGASFASHTLVKDDTNERMYYSAQNIDNKSTVQAEVTLNASTTYSPEIYDIELI